MSERLTGIAGSMFSGKTEELLRRVTRAEIAGREVLVFKPVIDNRWGKKGIVKSHSGSEHLAIDVDEPSEAFKWIDKNTKMASFDEIQFLDSNIIYVVQELLDRNIEVIFSGLPLDFRGEPFGSMPTLLALADNIVRLTAICTNKDNGEICGKDATRTQRFVNGKPANYNDPIVMVGAGEAYAPRCTFHHQVPGKPKNVLK